MKASKSNKRIDIINRIMCVLKTPEVFKELPYRNVKEYRLKLAQYPHLLNEVTKLYEEYKGFKYETARIRAKKNLLYEGNVTTTVSNILFMGTNHRPDFVLNFENGLKIAIEIKKGFSGDAIREGIGQAMVFSSSGYDFVIYLFVDITKEGKILNSIKGDREAKFIERLWNEHNILMDVI